MRPRSHRDAYQFDNSDSGRLRHTSCREHMIMTHTPHGIVIGFDGSPDSRSAVEYAASASHDLGLPLRVIHCYAWSETQTAVFHAAGRLLADLCETLEPHYPDLDLQPLVLSRSPASALIGESKTAQMVVVGHEGMGTFGGLHTGAVTRQVVNQAACPVVVTRGSKLPTGPVILSIGGWEAHDRPEHEEPSMAMAEWGAHTAHTSDTAHTAYTSDTAPPGPGAGLGSGTGPAGEDVSGAVQFAFVEAARRDVALYAFLLGEDVHRPISKEFEALCAHWHDRYPNVETHTEQIASSDAAHRLVDVARDAGLVVVGTPSGHHSRGVRMGSLPSTLLSEASCPVAIAEVCA